MSKRKLTYKRFKEYFSNNLQSKDKHDFEKQMMQDAFEEEAFDGLSKLNDDELEQDIQDLKLSIHQKTKDTKRIIPVWFRYAAGILIIVGIGASIFLFNNNIDQLPKLKEQIAEEIELVDSIQFEKEKELQVFAEETDTSKEFIADNKKSENTEPTKVTALEIDNTSEVKELTPPLQKELAGKTRIIKGRILSREDSISIPGVNIIVKGNPDIGTATNIDGEFTLALTEDEEEMKKLIASYVGMEAMEVNIQEDTNILVYMQPDIMELEEIVVTGYATVEKHVVTSSVVVVKAEEFDQALSGKVAGVQITESKNPLTIKTRKTTKAYYSDLRSELDEQRIVKGKIVGKEDKLAIPGVSIMLQGNPYIGTTTDIDGRFTLALPNDEEEIKKLIASFIGMETLELDIEGGTTILGYMEPDVLAMDEVVVVAYGTKKKESTTGSVVTINYDEDIKEHSGARPKLGMKKYKEFILGNLDYTLFSDFPGTHKVKLKFNVDVYGSLSNFEFTQSPDIIFNKEIERAMQNAGNWNPATTNGNARSSTVKLTLKIDVK